MLQSVQQLTADEESRIAALRDLDILGSVAEPRFDRITRWACEMFDVPISLISLVDRDSQWFKSVRGLPIAGTPRSVSFCGHTIRRDGPFVVLDARAHVDFAANPLVTGDPHIRFYAGAPVLSPDGQRIGTVCVIDTVPWKSFSQWQGKSLDLLARVTSAALADRVEDARGRSPVDYRGEMRTSMNAILGFTDMLSLGHAGELNQAQRSYLGLIRDAAAELLHTIDYMAPDMSGKAARGGRSDGTA